jgi:secretion/DNA translocation related TadE-like protein
MRETSDRGSAAVVVLAVFVAGMVLLVGASRVGAALIARARADTAADAAALAAADMLALGYDEHRATSAASETARANGADLEVCACAGPVVTVTVVVDVPVLGRVARVKASAEVRGFAVPAP